MSFHQNAEGNPWYQETGPNAKFIREDNFNKFKVNEITNEELNNILIKNIPDTNSFYCSWRSYAIHGITENTFNSIIKDIEKLKEEKKIKKAYIILNEKFIPCVIHKLYNPKGNMTKKISIRTNVGKK